MANATMYVDALVYIDPKETVAPCRSNYIERQQKQRSLSIQEIVKPTLSHLVPRDKRS